MGLSDSRPEPLPGLWIPPRRRRLSRHPAGPPRFLDGSVLAHRPQAPRRVRRLPMPMLHRRCQASSKRGGL